MVEHAFELSRGRQISVRSRPVRSTESFRTAKARERETLSQKEKRGNKGKEESDSKPNLAMTEHLRAKSNLLLLN